MLFLTGASRESATIIDNQIAAVSAGGPSLEAMHRLKTDAIAMKEALLFGRVEVIADLLELSWRSKKLTSTAVSNPMIDQLYDTAKAHGAVAGKVSGAGGGGFMMFLVDPTQRPYLFETLTKQPIGYPVICGFSYNGARTWRRR